MFREVVKASPLPFVTVVSDANVKSTVHGRVALVGDAAITPRPHAAAGAAKAAYDGWTLTDALAGSAEGRVQRLKEWERRQLAVGRGYLKKVRKMASRLQYGGDFAPGDPEFRFGLPREP